MSTSALPLISFRTSREIGRDGIRVAPRHVQHRFGERPALLRVEVAHGEEDPRQDLLVGSAPGPGGSSAFHFHCIQRAEFVKVPSFSAKPEAGSWKTSVWIFEASGVPYSFGAFQKVAVSMS